MTEMGERMDFEKGFNKYLHLKLLDEVADCKREQSTRFKCSEGTPFLCVVQTDFGRKIVYLHLENIKAEVADSELELDIDEVLQQDHPVIWLVEQKHFTDKALETITNILMHPDTDEESKQAFFCSAISYLDSKGYFSFLLHSYLDAGT